MKSKMKRTEFDEKFENNYKKFLDLEPEYNKVIHDMQMGFYCSCNWRIIQEEILKHSLVPPPKDFVNPKIRPRLSGSGGTIGYDVSCKSISTHWSKPDNVYLKVEVIWFDDGDDLLENLPQRSVDYTFEFTKWMLISKYFKRDFRLFANKYRTDWYSNRFKDIDNEIKRLKAVQNKLITG